LTSIFGVIPNIIMSVFKRGIDFVMSLPVIGPIIQKTDEMIRSLTNTPQNSVANEKTSIDATNQKIIDKLDELIGLMRSGGIAVNLDGRKVSQELSNVR
jgi:hypothetical protein